MPLAASGSGVGTGGSDDATVQTSSVVLVFVASLNAISRSKSSQFESSTFSIHPTLHSAA
jgi:hypothetical protein